MAGPTFPSLATALRAFCITNNSADGTFTEWRVRAGAAFNEDGRAQAGMGSTVAHYNGDGKLDYFQDELFRRIPPRCMNNGDGTLDDVTYRPDSPEHAYLGWGTMFLDFDNDTWPDLLARQRHVYPEVDSQHLGSNFRSRESSITITVTEIYGYSANAGPESPSQVHREAWR